MPGKLPGVRERFEVWDGPLIALGTAGADEVAQQMQMKADKDQQSGKPWMRRQSAALNNWSEGEPGERTGDKKRRNGAHNREGQAVKRVVILRKPQQRVGRMPGQKLRDDAQAIKIRRDGGGNHQRFFTPVERGWFARGRYGGQQPSGKEMRDRTQAAIVPQIAQINPYKKI